MMKKILILCLTFMIATELEVDGNLKVTGSVDASGNPIKNIGLPTTLNDAINGNALQDALRDDATYEYLFINVRFYYALYYASSLPFTAQYRYLENADFESNWNAHLNSLMLENWKVSNVYHGAEPWSNTNGSANSRHMYAIYELKRAIEE